MQITYNAIPTLGNIRKNAIRQKAIVNSDGYSSKMLVFGEWL